MEKETVIAKLRAEISIASEFREFLARFEGNENAWFAREGGDIFLAEFGLEWNETFVEVVQGEIDSYFLAIGVREDQLPKVRITDSRRGSWIVDAAITMYCTVGTSFTILKGVSELPKIADGLEETKNRIKKALSDRFRSKVSERIEPSISDPYLGKYGEAKAPSKKVDVSFSIDARPLRGLTPDSLKTHSIHLSVGVSRSALSIENLGEAALSDLRVGLFKDHSQRHNWNFADAYSKSVPILSGKQSISLSISEFLSMEDSSPLDLADLSPIFVDCWVQDNTGIYLFNFYLE